MTLKTDIDQIAVDAGKLHDIVHGGSTAVVATDGGTVKSVAKAIADLEAQIVTDAGSYLDQCQDEVALATAQAQTATNQAAAAAGSALSAASVVSQDLSAIDRTVFASTTLVDCFLYDTSKDSDGGAWRKRCAHTSWENETLSGNWLGSAANEAAARAISGATTGSYYYDTTAVVFYKLNAGSGVTQVYRGNARQFPAQVLITAETNRVVIWDVTQAGCPMWRSFPTPYAAAGLWTGGNVKCIAARQGIFVIGTDFSPLYVVRFASDDVVNYHASSSAVGKWNSPIAKWTTASTFSLLQIGTMVGNQHFSIAISVLPNAPIDVATGLQVPTIAVATNGNATYSTSVIMHDGTVVNVASDSTGTAVGVEFDGLSLKVIRSDGTVYIWNDVRALTTGASPSATITASSTPALLGTASKMCKRGKGSSTGLTVLRRNQLSLAVSMLAYITKDYNSGWQIGDIRGAWLADIVAETLTGAELVTNGDFTTDTTGWSVVNACSLSVVSGAMRVTASGASPSAGQSIATVIGKTYTVKATLAAISAVKNTYLNIGTSGGGEQIASVAMGSAATYRASYTFVATTATTYLSVAGSSGFVASDTFDVDDISCRLADVDRSVKAKGLQVFGSLTKTVVASGAQLVSYGGFSAVKYLEQPYNSDLDFGTGDFCIMGWLKQASNSAHETVFHRDSAVSAQSIQMRVNTSGVINAFITDDGYVSYDTVSSTAVVDDLAWRHIALIRSGSTLTLYFNGVLQATTTIAAAAASLSNAAAMLRFGVKIDGTAEMVNGTVALWRASATAPTAEQLRHIYETEKALFEANAQCCLAGTSNAVTALAYDDETDLLHVGTSYGRSAFKGLVRVASEATPVGAIVALAAGAGVIVQAGASGADVYVPAYTLREELLRDAEQMAKFGQNLIAHDFTATASQTNFALPVGWEIVAVYQQGALKRETTSWTRSFDGFVWSAVLGTGATVSDWISILAKRV